MPAEKEDELMETLLVDEKVLQQFDAAKLSPMNSVRDRIFWETVRAEITRRQTNEQIRLIRAQEKQLEAQGKQTETQSRLARSLRTATWVLAGATILLAIATVLPWLWPRH
jgi:cell division protein FtsX